MVKRIITAVVIWIVLALPGIFLKNPFGYFPAFAFAIAAGLSLLYIQLLKRSFTFFQTTENGRCELGKQETFYATVQGKGMFLFPRVTSYFYVSNLFGQNTQSAEADIVLFPGEKKTFRFTASFHHLGTYRAGISAVRLYDFFSFFYTTYRNEGENSITVQPRALPVTCFDFSAAAGHQSNSTVSRSKMEADDYDGIREYVPGDPIKNIHWKVSAHTRRYVVRQLESYAGRGYTVYWDMELTGHTSEDLMNLYDCLVETAYSVSCQALQEDAELEIVYMKNGAVRLEHPKSRENLNEALSELSEISVSDNGQLAEMLGANAVRRYGSDILVVCTANLSEALIPLLTAARELGKTVFLFYAVPETKKGRLSEDERNLLDLLLGIDIPVRVLSRADEIQDTEEIANAS